MDGATIQRYDPDVDRKMRQMSSIMEIAKFVMMMRSRHGIAGNNVHVTMREEMHDRWRYDVR